MNIEESIRELKGYLTWLEANGFSKLAKDSAIETLLTAYEKEKEERERIGKLYYEANENCIKYEKMIENQQKEIEELKNKNNKLMEELDLTTVYISGVYDGEKKVQDKIKAKIEELNNPESEFFKSLFNTNEPTWTVTIQRVLQSLLEKE